MSVSRWAKRFLRRGESGQSIVILALGFVGLLAFVGLTTDFSLMFVRYSTLRRAVDSAAIAAAGQMRQDRTIAEVGLAARQFIEFHNLNPRKVLVETCASTPDIDEVTAGIQKDPVLCPTDDRKIVRVTAEIDSPTVFLRLFGITNFPLRASAISETAVLDIVLVMDGSESMLNETRIQDWARVGLGVAYVPPRLGQPGVANSVYERERTLLRYIADPVADWFDNFWQRDLLGVTQETVNRRLVYTNYPGLTAPTNIIGGDPANDRASYQVQAFVPAGITGQQFHPREGCTVRFFPYSLALRPSAALRQTYQANGIPVPATWDGFAPSYDFYGCCNDPTTGGYIDEADLEAANIIGITGLDPDNDFSDLICQPMKAARDATRQFLQRIDFARGDRVAFVTFSRSAFLIDPEGTEGTPPACTPPENYPLMIASRCAAQYALDRYVGVNAEPNFYDWNERTGGWYQFSQGIDNNGNSIPINYYQLDGTTPSDPNYATSGDATPPDAGIVDLTRPSNYNNYPVKDNCPFQNATLPFPFSRYATRDNTQIGSYHERGSIYNVMTPDIYGDPTWLTGYPYLTYLNSYELNASCRSSNLGAALREANNALTDPDTKRSQGAVQVIIMLSDGAAGGSDPARRNGSIAQPAAPYVETGPQNYNPINGTGRTSFGVRGQYGAFGVCPYGNQSQPAELIDTLNENPTIFPYCQDEAPATRHFCFPAAVRPPGEPAFAPGSIDVNNKPYDVDIGSNYPNTMGNCDPYYDVDDYAKDWADFVTCVERDDFARMFGGRCGGQELTPNIFTISFGLDFPLGNGSCTANVPDCLGEELLRYIADAGDNFQIDIDYQQDYLDNGLLDNSLSAVDYGAPGICDAAGGGYLNNIQPGGPNPRDITFLTPEQSCGNYFSAPGPDELKIVFDEIASRMFTRLAG